MVAIFSIVTDLVGSKDYRRNVKKNGYLSPEDSLGSTLVLCTCGIRSKASPVPPLLTSKNELVSIFPRDVELALLQGFQAGFPWPISSRTVFYCRGREQFEGRCNLLPLPGFFLPLSQHLEAFTSDCVLPSPHIKQQ